MNVRSISFSLKESWVSAPFLFCVYMAARIFISFSIIVNAFTFKEIIDVATGKETFFHLSLYGVIGVRLVYEILRKFMEFLTSYSWSILASREMIHLSKKFVDKIATLDLAKLESPTDVGLIARAFNRLQNQQRFTSIIAGAMTSLLEVALSTCVFIFASPLIALFVLIANMVPIIVRSNMSHGIFQIFRADHETRRRFNYTSNLLHQRSTLPEIKLFQAFDFFKERMTEIYEMFTNKQLSKEKKAGIFGSLADLLPIGAIFFFLFVIAGQVTNGTMSVGMFSFYFTNVFLFFGALNRFAFNMEQLEVEANYTTDAVDFFDMKPSMAYPQLSGKSLVNIQKKLQYPMIEIKNLTFSYPHTGRPVLKNISFAIPFGQKIAIVGENGAGKSTLIKLLMRMYDPQKGEILINGINVRELSEDILFSLYSTLFQDYGKFYLTIRENLEVAARRKLTEKEIIQLLKFSGAWDFVKDKKHGIDQQLGPEYKDGSELSGGEWQKLGIARAHAKKAPILILDEPTANVDAKSEMEIFDRINHELQGNTLIFISHRFSTIKDAQRIVVLDKGELLEDGTHTELIQKNGIYAHLYALQAQRYLRNENE